MTKVINLTTEATIVAMANALDRVERLEHEGARLIAYTRAGIHAGDAGRRAVCVVRADARAGGFDGYISERATADRRATRMVSYAGLFGMAAPRLGDLRRYARPGLTIRAAMAPDGGDFNDVLTRAG